MDRQAIMHVLIRLNNNYGVGDVVGINYMTSTVICKPYGLQVRRRKFRVIGQTVYFLGHQQTIRG